VDAIGSNRHGNVGARVDQQLGRGIAGTESGKQSSPQIGQRPGFQVLLAQLEKIDPACSEAFSLLQKPGLALALVPGQPYAVGNGIAEHSSSVGAASAAEGAAELALISDGARCGNF
jgi:hypothetical protein